MPSEPLSFAAFLDRLEALAAKATPGPWRSGEPEPWAILRDNGEDEALHVGSLSLYADARYLAALDPGAVRRLIAAARAGEAIARAMSSVLCLINEGPDVMPRGAWRDAANEETHAALAAWRRATRGEV